VTALLGSVEKARSDIAAGVIGLGAPARGRTM